MTELLPTPADIKPLVETANLNPQLAAVLDAYIAGTLEIRPMGDRLDLILGGRAVEHAYDLFELTYEEIAESVVYDAMGSVQNLYQCKECSGQTWVTEQCPDTGEPVQTECRGCQRMTPVKGWLVHDTPDHDIVENDYDIEPF